jgi:hypothetical protein
LYIKIIEPLGHEAAERNNEFKISYENLINRLTKEFLNDFAMKMVVLIGKNY